MYKINYNGNEIIIGQKFALLIVEAVASDNEEDLVLEEVLEESQTTLTQFTPPVDRSRPQGHAKGWASHCARCGEAGRKCLTRLNNRCHSCKNNDDCLWSC
jgi:hypothetical protein